MTYQEKLKEEFNPNRLINVYFKLLCIDKVVLGFYYDIYENRTLEFGTMKELDINFDMNSIMKFNRAYFNAKNGSLTIYIDEGEIL